MAAHQHGGTHGFFWRNEVKIAMYYLLCIVDVIFLCAHVSRIRVENRPLIAFLV